MATASLRPTTMTENASTIVTTSRNLWEMYKEMHRLLNYGTVLVSDGAVTDIADLAEWLANGGVPNWAALQSDFGFSAPEQAAVFFDLMSKTAVQIQAETINGDPNRLREFMHKVG